MSLPRFAIQKTAITMTVVVLALVLGISQYFSMSRRADPAFTSRQCTITTVWPGVEAERVERLVTAPLEREVSQLSEVDYVRSTTTTGLSVIYVTLPDALPVDAIQETWERVRGKVDIVRPTLPPGTRDPEVNDDFGDSAAILLAVHEPIADGREQRYSPRELRTIASRIDERLFQIDGVSKTSLHGDRREAIYVETDPAVWASSALTISDLESLLAARNIRTPGGSLDTDKVRVGVQPSGEFTSVQEIGSVIVAGSDTGTPIRLSDAGFRVRRDYEDPPRHVVRYGDTSGDAPAIIVSAWMQDGFKVTDLGPEIVATVERMKAIDQTIPADIEVRVVFDEATFVDAKIRDFVINVLQAIGIVVAVAFVMAGPRSAIVMALAIPFVMITSIGISATAGVALEQMSIASLIIALGMLVDNAVVVCDNTKRFMEEGLAPRAAAVRGVEQIMFPTLMGTLTTVCAFAPMAFFLQGARQEFVFSIPFVVSTTLLTSWVLAMTLTTLAASWIIRPSEGRITTPLGLVGKLLFGKREGNPVLDGYAGVLRGLLRVKGLVITSLVAMFVGAALLPVGNEFFPDDLRDLAYVDVWLPEGASLERTDSAASEVEELIRELSPSDGVERLASMYTSVGGSGPRFSAGVSPTPPTANFAQIILQTTDPRATSAFVEDIRREAASRIPGVRVIPRKLALGPPVDSPVAVRVYARGFEDPGFGDEWTLRRVGDDIERVFRNTPGMWDVHGTWLDRGYQFDVDIDPDRANAAGVTNQSIAQTLSAYYSGHLLTTFRDGDDQIPVYFRLPPEQLSLDTPPQAIFVEGAAGKVPIDAVATIDLRRGLTRIERREQNRVLEVRAKVEPGYLANGRLAAARPGLSEIEDALPEGVWLEDAGTLAESAKSQREFVLAFGAGVLLIVVCLVVQYNSIVKPIIVLTTVPMGAIGAFVGLYVMGYPLGFMPLLGLVSLAGIVVNSAILYIEFADSAVADRRKTLGTPAAGARLVAGLPRDEFRSCLAEAGKIRLPAILLTACTTVGGLIPLALFGGPMWEGMATLLIFGLSIATAMTLLALPVVYAFFAEVLRINPVPEQVEV